MPKPMPVCLAFGLAFAAWLGDCPPTLLNAGEPAPVSLDVPNSIGELALDKIRNPSETDRSTQIVYKAPGVTLTLYIFGYTPTPADGIESPELQKEFEQAKQAIHDPRAWKRAEQIREGTAELGVPTHQFLAREAVFNLKSDQGKAISYLYITAAHGLFFKIRYTAFQKQREFGEDQLPHIREAVGELIDKAHRKPSTSEERAKAVQLARDLELDPMAADAVHKRQWLLDFYQRVPDITVTVCDLLGPLPKEDHPYFAFVLFQSMASSGAFMIEHPDQVKDQVAVQTAGVIGALKAYEVFVKEVPEVRLPFLDGLVKQRNEGTLVGYMRNAVEKGCK